MNILGIESSAHTLGIGAFSRGRIAANEKAFYKPGKGGIHPREAADFMAQNAGEVLSAALRKSGIAPGDFDAVAFTQGPGLGPCLQVGAALAKAFAAINQKPLLAVNHCVAHIEIARFCTGERDPVIVYASGGNTQIIAREGPRYRVLGETLDMGLGNAIDAFARELKLEWAHGSAVEKLAREGKYFELPYTVKGMDFAFSGLLTAATRSLQSHAKQDACKAFQETAFAMLAEATERALALTCKRSVLACGGVAQNARLREMLSSMCAARGARFASPPPEFNADNGAMVAFTGSLLFKAGRFADPAKAQVRQRYRVDEARIYWG
jgi:N6-L-threonylcarbamoyladenine synthase